RLPFMWRVGNGLVTCLTYINQMFCPARLAVFYPHPGYTLQLWKISLSIVFLLLVTAAAIVLRRKRPYFFTGWFWYLIMLLPVIGLIQVGSQGHADRYTYLSQIGLYILVAWGTPDALGLVGCRDLTLIESDAKTHCTPKALRAESIGRR